MTNRLESKPRRSLPLCWIPQWCRRKKKVNDE